MNLLRETEILAFDLSTVRMVNEDGHLHVSRTNISKANVCPYRGSEIPGYQALGLDANRIYQMYRDPEELKKAAPTFNGLPVLKQHVHVTSKRHRPDLVIGSTGSGCAFDNGFLQNWLSIWPDDSIRRIESDEQKEISSAYHYTPDMTPGVTPEGVAFDGVMRNLRGNHVAVVPKGRAGPDVLVADAALRRPRVYGVLNRKFKGVIHAW